MQITGERRLFPVTLLSHLRAARVLVFAALLVGCRRSGDADAGRAGVVLAAGSADHTIHLRGPLHTADIDFQLTNHTGSTLSANSCGAPIPPELQKRRADGSWVFAYNPLVLGCRTEPALRVADGGSYHGTLTLVAGRDSNISPTLLADSVPGTYRLKWRLRVGPNPDDETAPIFEPVSPPFRFKNPDSDSDAYRPPPPLGRLPTDSSILELLRRANPCMATLPPGLTRSDSLSPEVRCTLITTAIRIIHESSAASEILADLRRFRLDQVPCIALRTEGYRNPVNGQIELARWLVEFESESQPVIVAAIDRQTGNGWAYRVRKPFIGCMEARYP